MIEKKPKNGETKVKKENVAKDEAQKTEEVKPSPEIKGVYEFDLQQLVMKNDRWEMHTLIYKTLSVISKSYDLTLVVNTAPTDEKIELALQRLSRGQRTIDGSSPSQDEYDALLNAKQELIDNCPDISMFATVLKSQYVMGETKIVFWIPAEVIGKLNDRREWMEHYKIKMAPKTVES